jgi:hypothetical protein
MPPREPERYDAWGQDMWPPHPAEEEWIRSMTAGCDETWVQLPSGKVARIVIVGEDVEQAGGEDGNHGGRPSAERPEDEAA